MKCKYCGAEIPKGFVYCEKCGAEVQMVPDYNPLDDVLTAQVRGALDEEPSENMKRKIPISNVRNSNGMISYTMKIPLSGNWDEDIEPLSERENEQRMEHTSERIIEKYPVRNTGKVPERRPVRNTGKVAERHPESKPVRKAVKASPQKPAESSAQVRRRNTSYTPSKAALLREEKHQQEREAKKQARLEKIRMERRRKQKKVLTILAGTLAAAGIGYFIYLNTYHGLVGSGMKFLEESNYKAASSKFNQAVKQDDSSAEAYNGLAKVYMAQNKNDEAEFLYLHAISKYPANVELYRGCIEFYQKTDQLSKIPMLLDKCEDDGVLDDLYMYVSNEPKFSLEEKTYDIVQELSITSTGQKIFYTTDGTEPTTASTVYTEPIQIGEGTTTVKAISINAEGVPSIVVSKTYVVEFPVADAPAVSPSTGYYERQMQIIVQVPEGYTAYYTISSADGEIELPSASSTKYTGPIGMPEGNNIFCAVLVDSKGRLSEIKKMNYELDLE